MHRTKASFLTLAIVSVVVVAAACGDLFSVQSPGRIADQNLNNEGAIPGLVVGMANRIANIMGSSGDNMVIFSALVDGEMYHGGSYAWAQVPEGLVEPEDMGANWGAAQVARWTAEAGLRRMRDSILSDADFHDNPYVARAFMYASLANRILGENMCTAVFDGSSAEPAAAYFSRGIDQADSAIAIGGAANATEAVQAAYGARASMEAWMGNWSQAMADAQNVPDAFVFNAALQLPSPDNDLQYETYNRYEYTVYGTFMADSDMAALENMDGPAWSATHDSDPRAPWTILTNPDGSVTRGANGQTPMYQQDKYQAADSDMPLVKGTEMLLLRAEGQLRVNSDIGAAYDLMNQARDVYGMSHLTAPSDMATAWKDLHYERAATVWLEARHLWDATRWYAESGPMHSDAIADRDQCLPPSKSELDSNSNLSGFSASHPLTRQQ